MPGTRCSGQRRHCKAHLERIVIDLLSVCELKHTQPYYVAVEADHSSDLLTGIMVCGLEELWLG